MQASTRWLPALGFVEDTADALVQAAELRPGLYHADQNPRWSLFDVATALSARAGRPFTVVPTADFVYDQRLLDGRLRLPPLELRLPSLLG